MNRRFDNISVDEFRVNSDDLAGSQSITEVVLLKLIIEFRSCLSWRKNDAIFSLIPIPKSIQATHNFKCVLNRVQLVNCGIVRIQQVRSELVAVESLLPVQVEYTDVIGHALIDGF